MSLFVSCSSSVDLWDQWSQGLPLCRSPIVLFYEYHWFLTGVNYFKTCVYKFFELFVVRFSVLLLMCLCVGLNESLPPFWDCRRSPSSKQYLSPCFGPRGSRKSSLCCPLPLLRFRPFLFLTVGSLEIRRLCRKAFTSFFYERLYVLHFLQ